MSWKMTQEVREARLAGRLPGIKSPTEFLVLLVMADTCRGESRVASISVTELVTLSDVDRTTIWRAINKLEDLSYVRKLRRSNQFQAARFEVLPVVHVASAQRASGDAGCVDATCTEEEHVANEEEHVANEEEHVANEEEHVAWVQPFPPIPDNYPKEQSRRAGARARLATTDGRGKALARLDRLNETARSATAYQIAEAFSASLPVPIETGVVKEIGVQIDKCLRSDIAAAAIAAGLKAWTQSDSWSPTQIPKFVHKAGNRNGKPTDKALGWEAAGAELLAEMEQQ
jgi:hypothetical protein